jgi:hypothetical protein
VWRVPRSSLYAIKVAPAPATASPTTKRGPKTAQSDGEVVALIRHPTDVLRLATGHEVGDTPRPAPTASSPPAPTSAMRRHSRCPRA